MTVEEADKTRWTLEDSMKGNKCQAAVSALMLYCYRVRALMLQNEHRTQADVLSPHVIRCSPFFSRRGSSTFDISGLWTTKAMRGTGVRTSIENKRNNNLRNSKKKNEEEGVWLTGTDPFCF